MDIGVFDENHMESHGRDILQNGSLVQISNGEIEKIVNLLHGNPDAKFLIIASLPSLTENKLQSLKIFAD